MPRIVVSITAPNEPLDQALLTFDVPSSSTIKDLKNIIHAETTFPTATQQLYLNGRPLTNESQMLEEAGITDDELVAALIRRRRDVVQEQTEGESSSSHGDANPSRPGVDPDVERERQKQMALLDKDPFNVEAQRKIEEILRQERVTENLGVAYEINPSAFTRVNMLYIPVEVNGHLFKAMVATCAQATIISPACAEACGIMRLIDTRYSGVARGVGTAKILGRVHHVELKIGSIAIPCAVTVMEGNDTELLFGLDTLLRYKAKIDLDKHALCIEGIEVPFLSEYQISRPSYELRPSNPVTSGVQGIGIGAPTNPRTQTGATTTATSSTTTRPKSPPPSYIQHESAQEEFPQENIDQLVRLGFSKDVVIRVLSAANGDVELAAGILLMK